MKNRYLESHLGEGKAVLVLEIKLFEAHQVKADKNERVEVGLGKLESND